VQWISSSPEQWSTTQAPLPARSKYSLMYVGQGNGTGEDGWGLSEIHFLTRGVVGKMCLDTGAGRSFFSEDYVKRAGLEIKTLSTDEIRSVQLATRRYNSKAAGICC